LASILSIVAGIVNICGVLSVSTLTTNVTGHFAYFSEQLFLKKYTMSLVYLFYILAFLFGAFISSLIMEWVQRFRWRLAYVLPLSIEIAILTSVVILDPLPTSTSGRASVYLALILLFAMGLQNSLVTRISNSVVRTTHLTGTFTDLGIELSQLFFYRGTQQRARLRKNIALKLIIITCFFLGCTIGGFVYIHFALKTLLLPVSLLLFTQWYDQLLFRFYNLKRKLRNGDQDI
jgi:uncharacterized membrane protein YoaK (UPF0700 family)